MTVKNSLDLALPLKRHRFTVSEFHKMAEAGILTEDDRVELIEGEIVEMAPIGSRHAACVARLTALFAPLSGRAIVWVQNPIRLGEYSEPQSDLALIRPRADFYASGHPRAEDVLLLVEVADASLSYDREVKIPLYARSGVPEVWLIDLNQESIEVYRHPQGESYKEVRGFKRGEVISPLPLKELKVEVADILGESGT